MRSARSAHVHLCVPASVHVSSYVHSLARTQAKTDRLFCARGCVKALRLMFEIFLRCAAARPRDQHGVVMKDSPPILQRQLAFITEKYKDSWHSLRMRWLRESRLRQSRAACR